MFAARRVPLLALLVLVNACGDGESVNPDTGVVTTTPKEPTAVTPVVVDSTPGITAALTINLNALPNYASPAYPVHYDAAVRSQDNSPVDNPVTDKGATLGRVLFHDRRLSINQTVSCASCHQRANGLTDGEQFSVGFNTVDRTDMHSMRLGNARFYTPGRAFWDRRATSFEAQATQPIVNAVEMGFDEKNGGMAAVITRMNGLKYYPELFKAVFGDTLITETRMQRAIAQYVRSAVSTDSRFDAGFAQVYSAGLPDRGLSASFTTLTAQENRGKTLFVTPPQQGGAGCIVCHTAPAFALTANSLSNGLDAGESRVFKSPSLKGVAIGGPYMHDGRFTTLEQVVEHYNSGIQNGPALDNRLRGPGGVPQRLNLAAADKLALAAFLRTLTDTVLISNAKFSSPFRP